MIWSETEAETFSQMCFEQFVFCVYADYGWNLGVSVTRVILEYLVKWFEWILWHLCSCVSGKHTGRAVNGLIVKLVVS